ncbi:MAG: hypothetical protein GY842_05905, partial [bacterium]|nr:hypothetical protein [bacterium]
MAHAKLIAMSAVLTGLVWLFADQMLTASAALQVAIEPQAPAGEAYTVRTLEDHAQKFKVTVSGPQQVITRFREAGPLTITLPIQARTTGAVSVPLLELLRKDRAQFSGLIVDAVTPEYLQAVIDRDVTVRLPVWVDQGSYDYDVDPSTEPNTVQVVISERRLATIPPERRRLVVRAETLLRNKPQGELLSFLVPLEAKVDGVDVKLDPPQVSLRATVREQRI